MRRRILEIAIELGKQRTCSCSKYHHICVAFRGKKILAAGQNCVCRVYKKFGHVISTHAEHSTLIQIKDNKPFSILVIRINEKGDLRVSRPCSLCTKYMNRGYYNIDHVFYSDGQGIIKTSVKNLLQNEINVKHKSPMQFCSKKCCMAN